MAEATITPDMTVGDSRIHSAWLWMRELLKKAKKGFASGATKIRVQITRVASTTAGAVVAAGAQIALATRTGWNGAAKVATGAVGLAVKGVIQVARAASWVVDKIGKAVGWFTGLFSRKAGDAVNRGNERFTEWRSQALGSGYAQVDRATFGAQAAITSETASTIGRTVAGVTGVASLANVVTNGAVAAKAVSAIGPKAALMFGPASLLVVGAVAVLAGLGAWLFRRDEVEKRGWDMAFGSVVKAVPEPEPAPVPAPEPVVPQTPTADVQGAEAEVVDEELAIDITAEEGLAMKGTEEAVEAVMADPVAQEKSVTEAKAAQLRAAGMSIPVTNNMVRDALQIKFEAEGKPIPATFSKTLMNEMRTALKNGSEPLPPVPANA